MRKSPPLLLWVLPVVTGLVAIGIWYAVRAASGLQSWILPTPVEIVEAAWRERTRLLAGAGSTALGALAGFLLAGTLGFATALVLGVSRSLRAGLYPWLLVLQMTPVIVLTPIIVLWAGPGFPGIVTITCCQIAGSERVHTVEANPRLEPILRRNSELVASASL